MACEYCTPGDVSCPICAPSLEGDQMCRCGHLKRHHRLVNFADGPFIGAPALVCPGSVFSEQGHGASTNADAVDPVAEARHEGATRDKASSLAPRPEQEEEDAVRQEIADMESLPMLGATNEAQYEAQSARLAALKLKALQADVMVVVSDPNLSWDVARVRLGKALAGSFKADAAPRPGAEQADDQ